MRAIVVLSVFAVAALAYPEFSQDLWRRWQSDPTYSHALLMVPLTLWLLWRATMDVPASGPSVAALAVLAALSCCLALGAMLGIALVHQAVLPLLVLAALVAIFGSGALRRLAWPCMLLYFSLPIWDTINPLLQALTTDAVSRLIYLSGTPAFIEGNRVTVSAGVFEIAAGCSGLRFFIIALAVTAVYLELYVTGVGRWLRLMLLAALVATVGNWVRVFGVIQLGQRLGIDHPWVVDHTALGWVVFAATIGVVMLAAGRSGGRTPSGGQSPTMPRLAAWAGTLALASVIPVAASHWLSARQAQATPTPPAPVASNADRRAACGNWRSRYTNTDDYQQVAVTVGATPVCLDYAWYAYQRQGAELINSENRLFDARRFRPVDAPLTPGDSAADVRLLNELGGGGVLLFTWHLPGGVAARGEVHAKWLQLRQLLAGRPDAGMLTLAMRCGTVCQEELQQGRAPLDVPAAFADAMAALFPDRELVN